MSGSILPYHWRTVTLGDILSHISNGLTAPQDKSGQGFAVTRRETIADDRINAKKVGHVSDVSASDVIKYRLHPGDILFSHINSEPQIGRTVIYEGDPPLLLHGMNLLRLRTTEEADPHFLNLLLGFYRRNGAFIEIASRAVGQSSINQGKLKNLKISLPPLTEQRAIATNLRFVQNARAALEAEISLYDELFRVLREDLMTGRLSTLALVEEEVL